MTPRSDADITASAVLGLLLDDHPAHFHVEEIIREVATNSTVFGDRSDVLDAIRDLSRAGLLHCYSDFVFATRAAVRVDELGI